MERICEATVWRLILVGVSRDEDICRVFDVGPRLSVSGVWPSKIEKRHGVVGKIRTERVIVGADVRDGYVCIQGWKVETKTTIHELIETIYPG
ncbi:MAG: HisA/HisF-related TIM barrel protein [Butyricimonas faecihominis]